MKRLELEPSAPVGRHRAKEVRSAPTPIAKTGDTLPLHLPKNLVLLLEELCSVGNIPGGAAGYVTHRFTLLIRDNLASFTSGIISELFALYKFSDDIESDAVQEAAERWKLDDKSIVKRSRSGSVLTKCSRPAVPRTRLPLSIDVPEIFRASIERIIRSGGIPEEYGGAPDLLGQIAVSFNHEAILDLITDAVVSTAPELDARIFAAVHGTAELEKLRLSRRPEDEITAKFLNLQPNADGEAVAA